MMKKLQLLILALFVGFFVNAQAPEIGPSNENTNTPNRTLFDLIFAYDIGASGSTTVNGLAGVILINNEYWISEWQSDVIHLLDNTGGYIESFTVAGVTGTRSMTTDGTWLYIGTAATTIYVVDPVTRIIANTITVTTGSDAEARMCTYDSTLDGGNGGFWIGDFGSDIASIDMSGNELSVIPSAVHQTVIYGGAIDNVSPGGPFLWISDQTGTAPSRHFITQLDPATGAPTGVQYDFTADGGANGATEVLAGGLFISPDIPGMEAAFVGVCQCTPSNLLFGLELVPDPLGVGDNSIANFTLSPNPAVNGRVSIETSVPGEKQVQVFDVLGKQVINTVVTQDLDVSSLTQGIYMVQVTQNNISATKKLVVR